MYEHETKIRVRYSETDRMGYVYYGDYAQYYEVGRVELFRSLGFSYKGLEESGINLPVTDMQCQFLHPAFYDELITIKTVLPELPGVKIRFNYEIYNEKAILLNKGATTLVFYDPIKLRPCRAPQWMIDRLKSYF